MKVAIIGAGPAGLACAREFVKNGLTPDIFEKLSSIGHLNDHMGCTLRLFNRKVIDPLKYLDRQYGIHLKPLFPLTEITMLSPTKTAMIRGHGLGNIIKRGSKSYSIEKQLIAGLNQNITFNTYPSLEDLQQKYDSIVVATGNNSAAKELGIWTSLMNTQTRTATVLGRFKPGSITMWLNKDYSKNCYCYLLPESTNQANLVMIINDCSVGELEYYWKYFLIDAGITYTILETRDAEYNIGRVDTPRMRNIYFVGNAAGLTDSFLGFGLLNAIESGVLAARAILKGLNYAKLLYPIQKDLRLIQEYRKALNIMDQASLDRLVAFLGLPGVRHMVYNNPIFRIRYGLPAVKLYSSLAAGLRNG